MEKIILLGISGAGKSTLARKLHEELNLPLIHLDAIFHLPGGKMMDKNQFRTKQEEIFHTYDSWIIDGNYGSSLDLRVKYADAIIWLDFPAWLSAMRVLKRSFKYRKDKSTQPDMPEYFEEHMVSKEYLAFIWFVLTFNQKERPQIVEALRNRQKSATLIHLRSRREVHQFIATVKNEARD
jgi:adenylate kinase family enzyme